jgi:hypothetical protein
MKRMEANFSKQTETLQQQNQAMQNKIIQSERQNRFQPRGNFNWDKSKQSQQNQRVPTPLSGNNMVEQEDLPWCGPCDQPHSQDTCLYAKEITQLASEINKEGSSDLNNYVGDGPSMINNVHILANDQSVDQAAIERALTPKPSQEEIRRRIRERDWVTYQRRGKQMHQPPQDSQGQQPNQEVPKEILKRKQQVQPIRTQHGGSTSKASRDESMEVNIDLDAYLTKSHIIVPFLELIKIPSLRRKDEIVMGFSKDDPSQDQPIILQTTDRGGSNGKYDPFFIF